MTTAESLALLSALLGTAGTGVLFKGSFAFQPLEGATWGGPEVDEANVRIKGANARRRLWQPVGLALLLSSFLVQGVAAFV